MEQLKRAIVVALALAAGVAFSACETPADREIEPAERAPEGASGSAVPPGAEGYQREGGASGAAGVGEQSDAEETEK